MRKNRLRLKRCGKMLLLVMLLIFLRFPVFGEPLTGQAPTLSESEMKRYSDLEVDCLAELDLLIDDISAAAYEAIEQAAAEAARAAALAALEREAAAMREAEQQKADAERWRREAEAAKRNGVKNAVIAGLACFLGGLAIGAGGVILYGGR